MKNSIIFSIFFCSVLIFSLYSIPHNFGQSAFGHEHPSHAKCWDEGGFNQPYNFLDTTEFFLVLFLTILAYALWWFFGVGAAIYASIPGVNAVFYALKVISPAAGVPLAAYNCPPEIVPPPVTVAGKVNLECNAEGGFEFERIENTFVDAPNTLAPTSTEVLFDDGSPYPLPETLGYWESDIVFGGESFIPVVYVLSGTPVWVFIGIIFIITIIVDGIFLWADSSGKTGKDFSQKGLAKKVKKEGGKDALKKVGDFFKKLFKKSSKEAAKETSETGAKKGPSLLKKIGTKIKDAPAKAIEEQKKFCKKCIKQGQKAIIKGLEADPVFQWKDNANNAFPEDAFTIHPFHKITEAGIETSKKSFPLGKNEFTYFSKAHLKDEAKFPFNVYDSEAPYIIFRNQTGHETRDITVEANAHYGFKVTSKTLPQLKQGSYADDLCDKDPSFEYIGPDFFLLTKLKQEQYAPWKTADTAPRGYNALSSADIQRVVESELEFLGTDSYLPKRTAALDPYRTVEFSNLDPNDPRENFATARHLFSIVTNDAVNELLADNTKVVPTADLKLGSNLTDQITLKEIDILGMSKLDQEKITSMMEKEDPLKLSNISPEIKQTLLELSIEPKFVEGEEVDFVNFDLFGQLFDSLISSTPQGRPNIITATEPAQPNVFVDYQNVTVVDTIPPNILVTEDIAIEVNKTNIALTNHPTLKPNGCTGDPLIKSTIKCELEIRPPALFDIADPFPTLFTNVTDSNFDELKKANLQASFYHGVTFIAWKAVDYSNNTETAIQIVNIKIEGENVPPEANPIEEDAFSTVPQQITLIANNTDLDPLKFTIRQDPDKGIIDTPIDAVFLNKFTLPGVISQLTGITNEVNSTDGNPIPGVYFTDFRNQRVLFQNTNDDVQVSFEIAESLTQQPEGISLTPDGTFVIGDWKGNKIVEVNYTGNLIKQFDIEGLFSQTGVHNEKMLTVDEDSTIYVTDSIEGKITKLFDFDAFSNIQGIESNSNSVLVADQSQNKVYHFNTTGRFVENIPNQYFVNATDVTIDSDNYIYVLDIGNSTIQRFNPTLDDTKEFGDIGNDTASTFFDLPQGITSNGTTSDEITIFVADTGNHQIKKINEFELPYVEKYTNSSNDWVNIGDQEQIPSFSEPGELIFSSLTSTFGIPNHVYRDIENDIPPDYWQAQFNLDVPNIPGQNGPPASVFLWLLTNNTQHPQTVDPQDALGIIYENQVLKFYTRHNITTSSVTIVDNLPDKNKYLIQIEKLPFNLTTVVVSGDTFVTFNNYTSSEIKNLNFLQHANNKTSDEKTPDLTITDTVFNPVITWLGFCTSGPNCDTTTNSSKNFACTDGSCFGTGAGNQTGQFTNPKGISANSTHLFVTDDHRVQIFNSTGNHTMTLGSGNPSSGLYDFNSPSDIEVSFNGDMIVTDSGNNRVKIYHSNGTLKDTVNSSGFDNFTSPSGVGVDSSGDIYISDTGNDQVVKLNSAGSVIDLWKSSIDTRVPGYNEVYELYVPGLDASALDIEGDSVYIGDWSNGEENIIVSNSKGGKITKHDVSNQASDPHSIAVNEVGEIFVTYPSSQEILVLDPQTNTTGIDKLSIHPTGITISKNVTFSNGTDVLEFMDETAYVFDNSTEKIYAVDGTTLLPAFNARDLFSNLNDIAVNATHVFGLNAEDDKSKIIKIRWDKGIKDAFDSVGSNVTGITTGKNMDSNFIFFTTSNQTLSSLYKLDTSNTDPQPELIKSFDSISASGVSLNPQIVQFVNTTISADLGLNLIGPRGIAISDNQMFVSSHGTDVILVYNKTDTGDYVAGGQIFSPDLEAPTDIVFNPNGNLIIASSGTHKILEYNVTSQEIESLAEAVDGIVSPIGLAVSPNNHHLYVSNSYDNSIKRINLVNITTSEPVYPVDKQTMVPDETADPLFYFDAVRPENSEGFVSDFVNAENQGSLENPQHIEFGPDGAVYVSSFDSNEILRWNVTGEFLGAIINSTNTDLLDGPTGMKFSDDNETLFVSSLLANKVLQFNATSAEFLGVYSDEQTFSPDELEFAPNGNLYVSSSGSNKVLEYGNSPVRFYISDWSNGTKIISLDKNGDQVGEIFDIMPSLVNPGNIISDSEAKLWVADTGNKTLIRLNVAAMDVLESDIILTDEIVEVDVPDLTETEEGSGIYVDTEGEIYEEFVSDVITSVTPSGMSIDINDNLYVSDWPNHRIVALDKFGNFVGRILLNSTFTQPLDIAINQTSPENLDDIWVYDKDFDKNKGYLISLDLDKQFEVLEFSKELSPLLRGLDFNGTSLVTTPEDSGSLLNIDSSNSAKFTSKHFTIPLGIDVVDTNPNQEIYVTDWKESRILKLDSQGKFNEEFDLSSAGFATSQQGDIEVNTDDKYFWVVEPKRATINQINFTGNTVGTPSVADKYVWISGLDSDALDTFYVISNSNSTVKKYDIRGTLLASAKDQGFEIKTTESMKDISLGPGNYTNPPEFVYVGMTDTPAGQTPVHSIIKFNTSNLQNITQAEIPILPTSIAVGNNGTIYVSQSNMNILKLNPDLTQNGTFTIPSNTTITPPGNIEDMVIDDLNNLYAADKDRHRIYKYDLNNNNLIGWLGKCTSSISDNKFCDIDSQHSKGFVCKDDTCFLDDTLLSGRSVGQFFEPTSLAIDGLKNIYVGDVKLARDNTIDPEIEFALDVDGKCPDGTVQFSETTCREVFNKGNVPRVQKFTQNGYFVNQVISDTNSTLVRGNFEWINGLAYGTNNFYVADVEKLHVFDVNPFFNYTTDSSTNKTTVEVTYQSFTELVGTKDYDSFLYQVSDGFEDSDIAPVNVTISDPDPDNDGILGDIDLSFYDFSSQFEGEDKTNGYVVNNGTQILTIREAKDPEKGVYTQSFITSDNEPATIRYCDDLAEITIKPGNRLIVTCTVNEENNEVIEGVEVEVIRGKIDIKFFDRQGRIATSQILLENTIHFSPDPFEFVTPKSNLDILNQTIHYNGKDYSYLVPKNSVVRIDTAPPILPNDRCTTPLVLEAETLFGVEYNGTIYDLNQHKRFEDWLNFTSIEVDNGNRPETDGDKVEVVSNVTSIEDRKFPHIAGIIPTSTLVEFFTIDKVGNNATCINTINVRDTTPPILEQLPDIVEITGKFSERGNAFFELPEIYDRPTTFNGNRTLVVDTATNSAVQAKCSPISGYEFNVGNTTVICSGYDLSGNKNSTTFTVTINPDPEGVSIKNVTAAGKTPNLQNGDTVLVEFSHPINQPQVNNSTDLNKIFEITNGTLGDDVSGKFIDPSNLLITINDKTTADLTKDKTLFDLRSTSDHLLLQSASGILNSTGHYRSINQTFVSTPVPLMGDFSKPLAPYITSFMVTDPFDNGDLNDDEYSIEDEFIIRFSEPTNAPNFGKILTKDEVNELFSFTSVLGEKYVGTWKTPSTFIITVLDLMGSTDNDPTLGTTQTQVKDNQITNRQGNSVYSTSVSPPLSGSFGALSLIQDVNENRNLVKDLPSGIKLGISIPTIDRTSTVMLNETSTPQITYYNSTTIFIQESLFDTLDYIPVSEILDVTITNSTEDCKNGCEISFYLQYDDVPSGVDKFFILHDKNDDGIIDDTDILIPTIERITNYLLRISANINSFSTVALVGLPSGGGGDETAPDYQSASLGGGGSVVYLDDINFENSIEKSIIKVGEEYKLSISLYENSGPDAIQHISLYTDLRGFEREVHHSDAYIRWDKGAGLATHDPQNLFQETDIFMLKNGQNLEVEFTIIFNKPMQESDLVVRAWDVNRNSWDTRFVKALEVIPAEILDMPLIAEEISLDMETFEKWSSLSGDSISDSDLLASMGLEGKSIPEWYKIIVLPWIQEGLISLEEFVNSIKFFEARGLLG